jgi:hypothetical protein
MLRIVELINVREPSAFSVTVTRTASFGVVGGICAMIGRVKGRPIARNTKSELGDIVQDAQFK